MAYQRHRSKVCRAELPDKLAGLAFMARKIIRAAQIAFRKNLMHQRAGIVDIDAALTDLYTEIGGSLPGHYVITEIPSTPERVAVINNL